MKMKRFRFKTATVRTALLALALASSVMGANAQDFYVNGVKYSINAGTQTVTIAEQTPDSVRSVVVIPAVVTNNGQEYDVTGMAGGAFTACLNLTSVTLPSSLETIGVKRIDPRDYQDRYERPEDDPWPSDFPTFYTGSGAFAGCINLTTANLSACQFTETRGAMFAGCTNLTSVSMPNTLSTFTDYDFLLCKNLRTINLENTALVTIGNYTFHQQNGGDGLMYVYLPETVTTIGKSAFYKNGLRRITDLGANTTTPTPEQLEDYPWLTPTTNLSNVNHLGHVTSVGEYAFSGNYYIENIALPRLTGGIGKNTFAANTSLKWAYLGAGVTSIGYQAFKANYGLSQMTYYGTGTTITNGTTLSDATLTLPYGVTTIGEEAFCDLTNATVIKFGPNLEQIGKKAFNVVTDGFSTSITDVYCEATEAPKLFRGTNNTFNYPIIATLHYPVGATGYTEQGSGNAILSRFAQKCWGYFFPNPVTFQTNNNVTQSVLARTRTNVQTRPSGYLYAVGENGVAYRLNPSDNTATVIDIMKEMEQDESLLEDTDLLEALSTTNTMVDDYSYISPGLKSKGVVEIESTINGYNVTSIAPAAFENNRWLKEITIPAGIKFEKERLVNSNLLPWFFNSSVHEMYNDMSFTFYGCSNLEKITFKGDVEGGTLGAGVFSQCLSLKEIVWPTNINKIEFGAFVGCYSMENVEIPTTVTEVDPFSFARTGIPSEYNEAGYNTVLGATHGITNFGYYFPETGSYSSKTNAESYINHGLASLGLTTDFSYDKFYGKGLKSVTFPSTVTEIGECCFRDAHWIETIGFGENVENGKVILTNIETIGNNAFQLCKNVKKVEINSVAVPSIGENAFDRISSEATLYAQNGTKENYSAIASNFAAIAVRDVRTLTSGNFGTVCLGYDCAITDELKAKVDIYEVVGKTEDGGELMSITIDVIPETETVLTAGKPYFFRAKADVTGFAFEKTENSVILNNAQAEHANGLYGALDPTTVDEGVYMLKNNTLYKAASGSKCAANRAYLDASLIVNKNQPLSAKAKRFQFDDDATGILFLESDNQQPVSTAVYDLSGRRVTAPAAQKGIYIHNGKKVVR